MVDVTPGDSGANKGFWRQQLRDRYGRFLDMGGKVLFEVQIPGVSGTVRARGTVKDVVGPDTVLIEVGDNKLIPRGSYEINRKFIENDTTDDNTPDVPAKATSPAPDAGQTSETTSELKPSISGDEALKIRMKSVARALKEKGRFPMPRVSSMGQRGVQNSDVASGAKIDYKTTYDASPELQEMFPSFDDVWNYVSRMGTDLTTQSPNELKDIPEEMKLLNREYAKHVLGIEPNGFITVYRNAINGKDTEQESAVGYVSLDRDMAYDYGSTRENVAANGRYEIDVKPDEVYGMLGYSRVEDEYGLTIGREVAYTPDRVRRVGDLAPIELPHWLQEWNSSFKRGQGASPLRGFGLPSHYNFHEVEDFLPENIQGFLEKYNLQSSDIATKFDELYGEGSYAEYKASGNNVSYQEIQKMFVKLDNGNLGLNVEYLEGFNGLNDTETYKNDRLDNRLKMLSLFQEITGQHFMTHKTRDYTPPIEPSKASPVLDEAPSAETPSVEPAEVAPLVETAPSSGIKPGYENWMSSMSDILGFNDDEDSPAEPNPALGNELLSKTLEKAGYNEKPKVVSTEEFNSIEGETIYRAVIDEKFVDQYLNSADHFAGTGVFGNGTYSTNKRESAEAYAGSTNDDPDVINARMLEMKLSPDAKVLSFSSKRELRKWVEENAAKFKQEFLKFGANQGEIHEFEWQINNASDWTNLAVMAGFDAIRFPPDAPTEHFTIILNRGKVIANGKS